MSNHVPIESLNPAEYNPRRITASNMRRLKQSIAHHSSTRGDQGYRLVSAITVNRQGNRIVGGHQRVRALQELGQDWIHRDDIVWVDVKVGSSQERAINLALNSPDAQGVFDDEQLRALLAEFDDIELELTAFDRDWVDRVVADFRNAAEYEDGGPVIDDLPEPEIVGEDTRTKRFMLIYRSQKEKDYWCRLLGIPSTTERVVLTPNDVKKG